MLIQQTQISIDLHDDKLILRLSVGLLLVAFRFVLVLSVCGVVLLVGGRCRRVSLLNWLPVLLAS